MFTFINKNGLFGKAEKEKSSSKVLEMFALLED